MSELGNLQDEIVKIESGEPWHGLSLNEILSDVTAGEAEAHPFPGIHSIREILLHMAAWQEVGCLRLNGQDATVPDEANFPAELPSGEAGWQAARKRLTEAQRRLLSIVTAGMSEASLEAKVAGRDYSVGFLLHGLVSHFVYHSGQISMLKKALRATAAE